MAGKDADAGAEATPVPQQPKKERMKITYDKYMAILNMLVRRVNNDQSATEDGVEEDELLMRYLERRESELETQEDLESERALARKVLRKMVKENMLMPI
ncbi:hypothetical protein LTS18_009522 [Coniosporium uncinatum]|uniref:Uncharacterized protein n=1 Tax=Coniosporium uncinatum TaxID=93489 RepID=A0ACC3DAE8_9PEZI|nr:hypothetical protein LTS18_009522 [Coniosporium uncinatum]